MARSLEALQKQYNSAATDPRKGPGPGGRGPGGPGPGHGRGMGGGKPKDTGKTIRRLLGYVSKYKFRLIVVLLCMLINTVTSLLGAYILAPIINHLTLAVKPGADIKMSILEKTADSFISNIADSIAETFGKSAEVMLYVFTAVVILLCIYLVGIFCNYLQARLMLTVTQGAIENIRNDLFNKMQKLPIRYFDSHPTGEVMSRYTNDVDNIEVMLSNSLTSIISGSVSLIGTFVFMITTNWILTLVTIVFIPIFTIGGGMIAKASGKYYKGQQNALGAVNGYIEESVSGQKVIKVFNHEDTCVEEQEFDRITLCRRFLAVDVDQIPHRLKGIKGDTHRQKQRWDLHGVLYPKGVQQTIDVMHRKAGILQHRQDAEIKC